MSSSYECLIYGGAYYSIEWGLDKAGTCQARDYYNALDEGDRAKALALFKRMADVGKIYDTAKFTKETEKLYVFKPQPHRFFSFFVKGKRIIVVSAYRKQGQKMPLRERERAEALMGTWLREEVRRGQH
jgi:hypothetical protein